MILKHFAEDFKVEELLNQELNLQEFKDCKHHYALFKVVKKNLSTFEAVNILSSKLKINSKFVSFAGLKDKKAVTSQFFTIKNYSRSIKRVEFKNNKAWLKAELQGFVDKQLKHGMISFNKFEIVVRKLSEKKANIAFDKHQALITPNYFDEQRFSDLNINIGECLVKKQFLKACELLGVDKHNALQSLNKYNKQLLRFFVNSFQSFAWNYALTNTLQECCKTLSIDCYKVRYSKHFFVFPKRFNKDWVLIQGLLPGFGYDSEFENLLENASQSFETRCFITSFDKHLRSFLTSHGLSFESFIIKSVSGISCEAQPRQLFVKPLDFKIHFFKDEVFNNWKALLEFKLPSGCYATIIAKQLFG